jgi:hypothetical protein
MRLKLLTTLSLNSRAQDPLSHYRWRLPVGLLCHVNLPLSVDQSPTYSWEFLTTLDYEINIIRGHIPYRWTIWVRVSSLCNLPLPPTQSLGLTSNLGRSTPFPVLQPW